MYLVINRKKGDSFSQMKKSKTNRIKLSQCMIVKNEEKNIRRALSWGRGIVSEQIVVDTGSTDRTVEIAEEMGAKVYHFKWINDFSAAKNYAIEQAGGDWIAFLDADEYFSKESAKKLIPLIRQIEDIQKNGEKVYVITSRLVNIEEDGKIGAVGHQDRIFRRDSRLKYHNKIHEVLKFSDHTSYNGFDAREDLVIIHTGYTKEAYEETGKTQRNIELLEKELLVDRDNVETLAYLGDAYMAEGKQEEAKKYFYRAIECGEEKGERIHTIRSVAMLIILYTRKFDIHQEEIVRELYQKNVKMQTDHPDSEGYFGAWLYQKKEYAEAKRHLEAALEKMKRYNGLLPVYMSVDLKVFYMQLADCCSHLDNRDEAVRYAVMALGVDKYYTYPLIMLLNLLKGEQGEAETASGTWDILSQLYNVSSLKDQMTILKGAKLTAFPALEKRVFDAMPEDQRRAVQEAIHKKTEEMRAHAKSPEKAD